MVAPSSIRIAQRRRRLRGSVDVHTAQRQPITGTPLEDIPEDTLYRHFTSRRSRQRGDYIRILDHWLEIFPREQVYIGFFDDIVERPRELLGEVFRHLGVSDNVDYSAFPYQKRINKGVGVQMPERCRAVLSDMYRDDIERLYERFGERVAAWRCVTPAARLVNQQGGRV